MIRLSLSSFISLCMFFSIVGLLGAWFAYECCRKIKNLKETRGNIWHCDICTHIYVDNNDKTLSLCPRCGSYNSRA